MKTPNREPFAARRWTRLLAPLLLATTLAAQTATDQLVGEYEKRRREELLEAGQRHVNLGWSIRDSGLIQQATWQFVRAVELSEGTHQGAAMVLGIVRNHGDAFWKKKRKTPSKQGLRAYEKKAAAVERQDVAGQVKLARLARRAKLTQREQEHWLAALRMGAEVATTTKGTTIEGVAIADDLATWLQAQVTVVNGGTARFEPAGAAAPRLANVRQVGNEQVVVRTDLPGDAAETLHALALAQWPLLEQRLGSAPVRPLGLFVFAARADYEQYLRACGHGDALGGSGLCDYGTFQTLVCAEGRAPEDVHALVLHELAHLFFFGCSPVSMPDWYAEGFAESFGGQGTFRWQARRLSIGEAMQRHRLEAMKQAPLPLRDLLAAKATALLAADHDRAMRWYAQCWALHRWLSQPDNPWHERFVAWEAACRGALPGVQTTARQGDAAAPAAAFEREFGAELDAIERAFAAWLAQL